MQKISFSPTTKATKNSYTKLVGLTTGAVATPFLLTLSVCGKKFNPKVFAGASIFSAAAFGAYICTDKYLSQNNKYKDKIRNSSLLGLVTTLAAPFVFKTINNDNIKKIKIPPFAKLCMSICAGIMTSLLAFQTSIAGEKNSPKEEKWLTIIMGILQTIALPLAFWFLPTKNKKNKNAIYKLSLANAIAAFPLNYGVLKLNSSCTKEKTLTEYLSKKIKRNQN